MTVLGIQFTRAIYKTVSIMRSAALKLIFTLTAAFPSWHCIQKKLPMAGSVDVFL